MPELDGLVCDLDGVLYRGPEPIPGVAERIAELRDSGLRFVFATNNATATVEQYRERLLALGIDASHEEILTSAVVTAEVVSERGWTNLSTFVVGLAGIRHELIDLGMKLLELDEANEAELVITSGDWTFDYAKLRAASLAVQGGAHFIATNDDLTYPAPDGLWPGAGSILAALEAATGQEAEVMGKPYRPMMEAAARRLQGCTRIGVVGDQPATDLAGAELMGWTKILVLSGVVTSADGVEPVPDLVLPSLAELTLG
jgi:4-nitrophenyl phosphatase